MLLYNVEGLPFTSESNLLITRPDAPIPLVVVYPDKCKYVWHSPMNKDLGFPFFPVIYINKPLMYVRCMSMTKGF